ncbi:MAG: hypothetical protein P1P82_10355 [Bacteroidales bacterium]|nr:hypothetical protein [Bacteroidales bacterium]MDT8430983.1 hypothetical protein [Bacteroidales bacterium]
MNIVKLVLIVSFGMMLAGCQEEFFEITEPDTTTTFFADDTISDLILKVTLKDGSFDNIIDQCSETSIDFPYMVKVRNEIIQIDSGEDIEMLAQQHLQVRKNLRINFPVTVTFSDYTTSVLNNRGELQQIQNRYRHRLKDDDIECIDFVYPVAISLYDTQYQKQESKWAGSDKEMHGIVKGKKEVIIEIGYPVVLEKADGITIEVTNNAELENAIIQSMGTCDENDEVEFDDEDHFGNA